jgi:hypothetical protein
MIDHRFLLYYTGVREMHVICLGMFGPFLQVSTVFVTSIQT